MYPTTLLARRVDNDSVAYTLHNVKFGFDILIHATAQLKKDIVWAYPYPLRAPSSLFQDRIYLSTFNF